MAEAGAAARKEEAIDEGCECRPQSGWSRRQGQLAVTLLSAAVCAAVAAASRSHEASLLLGVRESGAHQRGSRVQRLVRGGRGISLSTSSRILYAGIVPYREERSRSHPRAVACRGGSSVTCVLSAAEDGLHNAMAADGKPGPGKLAIEQAAKGRGFAEWHVAHQTKAARIAARDAVADSSGHGQGPLPSTCTSRLLLVVIPAQAIMCVCALRDRERERSE